MIPALKQRLDEIEARAKAATQVVRWYPHTEDGTVRGPFHRWFTCRGGDAKYTADMDVEYCITCSGGDAKYTADMDADVEYCAEAMNSVPYLLAELRKAHEEIEKLEAKVASQAEVIAENLSNKAEDRHRMHMAEERQRIRS